MCKINISENVFEADWVDAIRKYDWFIYLFTY